MPVNNNALNGTRQGQAYIGVNAPQPPNVVQVNRSPSTQDYQNFYQGDLWINKTTKQLYVFMGRDSTGAAQWPLVTSASGDVVSLSDTAGTIVPPSITGNIQLVGDATSGIGVIANPGSNLLTITNSNRSDVTAQTNDDTPTAIETYAIPTTSSIIVSATVLGSKADFSTTAGLIISRAFRRAGAGAIACGATVQQVLCSDAPGGVTADLTLVGNSAALVVTGEAATTYNWSATFEYITIPV